MTNHIHLNQQAWEVGGWWAIFFDDQNLVVVIFWPFVPFPTHTINNTMSTTHDE
jgi:hypothetical protein